ncbi:MAG TPA: alpha-glucan family phosphorylase [Trueperaceae bacterium]|nr:alpha-glucan family phosphorylase [Trueperaceae bacterium]
MNIIGHITLLPRIPAPIARLEELAHNLYWTWDPDARRLFRRLDRDLWEASNHNPIALIRDIHQERLDGAAVDADYLALYGSVLERFDGYLSERSWFQQTGGRDQDLYAYFCAEYGWHEAVALYSGGLGVLAGDHTKAASDLGVPLVAVGLFYPEGYFHQRVASDGRQEAVYVRHSPAELPLTLAVDGKGKPVEATVDVFGHEVALRAWTVRAGRASVYLLDVDFAGNAPEDRQLLRRLYGGDQRTRVAQEIILGIGGVRMLRALGVDPSAWHMNEGHSAFMVLERCRELVAGGLGFDEAREAVTANTLFTVHTPVAAGNDAFAFDLVNQCFGGYWERLGLDEGAFHALGKADHGWGPVFSMPALALRFSSGRNGVARLHGETSRRIWSDLWPGVPIAEIPIGHVTNGVHLSSWMAPEVQELLGTVLPADWPLRFDDLDMWREVRKLDDAALWDVRRTLKVQSVRFLRGRVLRQLDRQEASPTALKDTGQLFDPNALTVGFARRFATYKRATLIFRDLERLERILADPARPVQLVFSGKAHPADEPGQALIAHIHNLSKDPRFSGRILFVEDYDMAVGRALTRGVDVWLNNPRRPLEASGTSGQKAAMNGILNLSILDGWWPEGFDGENGWAIGGGRSFEDDERADAEDADALYAILEREVVPLYYDRDEGGVPHGWLERVKEAVATVAPRFNAQRMVKDYVTRYYQPASQRGRAMRANGHRAATELAAWRKRVTEQWPAAHFSAQPMEDRLRRIGEELEVTAVLDAQELPEDEVRVELVYSRDEAELEHDIHVVPMARVDAHPDGGSVYRARFTPQVSGRLAYGVRAYAVHPALADAADSGAVRWA